MWFLPDRGILRGTGLAFSPVEKMMTTAAKRSRLLAASGMFVALLTSACASLPPVRMDATPRDYEMLAGEWRGEYSSAALGRRGTIEFKLVAGENKASGDVIMVPQSSGRPYERQYNGDGSQTYYGGGRSDSRMLTIFFVRAFGGAIEGMLDRYWDPDRNCNAMTVFRGTLAGRTIAGTFSTTWECGVGEATGEWKVTRKASTQTALR
jgi:hypothetical protein